MNFISIQIWTSPPSHSLMSCSFIGPKLMPCITMMVTDNKLMMKEQKELNAINLKSLSLFFFYPNDIFAWHEKKKKRKESIFQGKSLENHLFFSLFLLIYPHFTIQHWITGKGRCLIRKKRKKSKKMSPPTLYFHKRIESPPNTKSI